MDGTRKSLNLGYDSECASMEVGWGIKVKEMLTEKRVRSVAER